LQNIVVDSVLYAGIPELLFFLKEKNIAIAVNTNKPQEQTLLLADRLLTPFHFEVLMGQKVEQPKKPDPCGALLIAQQLKIAPSEILYVGDSSVDVNTARAAGMQFVGVTWGYGKNQAMIEAGCDHMVETTLELKEFIKNKIDTYEN
jgi:phosphoglycolate phosphatase